MLQSEQELVGKDTDEMALNAVSLAANASRKRMRYITSFLLFALI